MPVAISTRDKTWCKMFPTTFKTEQQSLVFMKKLFAVAISNIVYIRAVFPEYAFFDKQLEGIKLKILREDSKCPGATKVISWVRGCFDALDKRYLRTVIIGFYTDPNDPDTVLESYSFKFSYGVEGMSIELQTTNIENETLKCKEPPEKIRKATLSLLRTMILAGNTQNPLPEKVIMTMKLLYYDEVTPDDYQPVGFKTSDYAGFRHETETINAKLGQVETNFHGFRMVLRTDKTSFTENYLKDKNSSNINEENKNKPFDQEEEIINNTENESETNQINEFIVRCPCGGNKDDGIMIMCELCSNWQHSVCFGILNEESVPDVHICEICADESNMDSSNNEIKKLTLDERQELCLMRRALFHCRSFDIIDPNQLAEILGIEINVSKGIFHNLLSESIICNPKRRAKGKGLSKVIDKKTLEEKITLKYFKNTMEVTIVKNSTRKRSIKNSLDDLKNSEENEFIMQTSQDSILNNTPVSKRLRACVAKTPIITSKN